MAKLSAAERSQIYNELIEATSPLTAEVIMHGVADIRWDDLATKSDVAAVRGEFFGLKGEFADLKGEFADLKGEFFGLRGEFAAQRADLVELRSDLEIGFADVRSEMRVGFARVDAKLEEQFRKQLVWLVGTIIAVVSVLAVVSPHL